MNTYQSAGHDFDLRARTWDDDPMKTARAQAVANAIRTRIPRLNRMSGLEYGCGTGLLSFALQPDLQQITLADNSTGMLDVLCEKIAANKVPNMRPMQLDLTIDPLPEQRFDIVYSLMTFHHVMDIDAILRKLHSVLNKPGHLCIADLDSEDGSFHGHTFAGHKGFDRTDLTIRAERAGFGNIEFSTVFSIRKGQPEKTYPVFLMTAQMA